MHKTFPNDGGETVKISKNWNSNFDFIVFES